MVVYFTIIAVPDVGEYFAITAVPDVVAYFEIIAIPDQGSPSLVETSPQSGRGL